MGNQIVLISELENYRSWLGNTEKKNQAKIIQLADAFRVPPSPLTLKGTTHS